MSSGKVVGGQRFYVCAGAGQDFWAVEEVIAYAGWEKEVPKKLVACPSNDTEVNELVQHLR